MLPQSLDQGSSKLTVCPLFLFGPKAEVQRWFMDNGDSISIEGSRLKTISRELEANLESGGRVAVSSQRDLGLAILLLHLQRESDLQLVYFGSLDDRDLDAAELQLTKEVAGTCQMTKIGKTRPTILTRNTSI